MKSCPHCSSLINIRNLRKVPRAPAERWFQFTPAPHTACPECGGFVMSSLANSRGFAIVFSATVGVILAPLFIPAVSNAFAIVPGLIFWLAGLIAALGLVALRRSKLVCETPGG